MSYSTSRKYYEDGSGRVEYNAYNDENYSRSGDNFQSTYIGGLGDTCENKNQCHTNLYCYSGICSHWNSFSDPFKDQPIYIQRSANADVRLCTYKEDCPGGWVCVNQTCQLPAVVSPEKNKEGFSTNSAQPSRQLSYSSKYKANSGKNYYSYNNTR